MKFKEKHKLKFLRKIFLKNSLIQNVIRHIFFYSSKIRVNIGTQVYFPSFTELRERTINWPLNHSCREVLVFAEIYVLFAEVQQIIVIHLGHRDRGMLAWRTKPSALYHAVLCSANLCSENFLHHNIYVPGGFP